MNNLSLLIYLAEVAGNLSSVSSFMAFLFGLLSVVALLIFIAVRVTPNDKDSQAFRPTSNLLLAAAVTVFITTTFLSIFTPSTNTIYMMAASEAGETIVTNPVTQDLFQDLTALIKKKISDELVQK